MEREEKLSVICIKVVVTELRMDWIHPWIGLDWIGLGRNCEERVSVSYTHLTLPTILRV